MTYEWIPGKNLNAKSIERLKSLAPKPAEVMGEAWFMGEQRRIFHELDAEPETIPLSILQEVFAEIISGIRSFGAYEEWVDWAHYLVPRLVHRSGEFNLSALGEVLVGAVLQVSLGVEPHERHRTYCKDVLETLGQSLMAPENWNDGRVRVGTMLCRSNNNPARYWGWGSASGDLSASMFLCLRFLQANEIEKWVGSIFKIECPIWRMQIFVWYLTWCNHPTGFPSGFEHSKPSLNWDWSHSLNGFHGERSVASHFVTPANADEFEAVFKLHFEQFDLDKFQSEIQEIEFLWTEVSPLFGRIRAAQALER